MSVSVDGVYSCPYCPCLFFSQFDLDSHLTAFGREDHERLWRCEHILLEEDGFNAGVDGHGDWGSRKRLGYRKIVKGCRDWRARTLSEL